VGFFDGHVETLGDLEGSDPSFWNPPGTGIPSTEFQGQTDTKKTYGVSYAFNFYWYTK
jgi:hypothetical protein